MLTRLVLTRLQTISRPVYFLRAEASCVLSGARGVTTPCFSSLAIFARLFLVPDFILLMYAHGSNHWANSLNDVVQSYVLPVLLGILAAVSASA